MPSKYCEKLPRCKNAWWCATDYRPSKNVKCFCAMTNYERLVGKTPEELAEWLSQFDCSADCKARRDACGYGNNCYKAWLDWLKQEAE